MKIKFIYGEDSAESTDFAQATLDFYYDENAKKYNKRFTGQIPFSKGFNVVQFLENNSVGFDVLFNIEFYNNEEVKLDELVNGKLFIINRDVINDYCRVELRNQIV